SMEKSNNIHWEEVAERLVGFSAALVVKIARDAAKIAVIGNEKIVNQNHIETSLGENIQYLK
ncbi:MAG: ATP-binding protein, partial [Cyclobacteriaceae bacterium]